MTIFWRHRASVVLSVLPGLVASWMGGSSSAQVPGTERSSKEVSSQSASSQVALSRGASSQIDLYALDFQGDVRDADRELVREALELGTASLVEYFDDPAVIEAWRAASVEVVVFAEPTARASETMASVRSGTRDGRASTYYASVHVLAPSSYSPTATTSIGEPKDDAYTGRLVLHELSTVPLDLTTRIKAAGWRFHDGPDWFVQGYQEYLGMTCAPGDDGVAALERRTRLVAKDPGRVDDAFGLDVDGPYVTGAVLVRFMHEQYGANRVKHILKSPEPTFGRAVREALGVDLPTFMQDWRAWLDARKSDDVPTTGQAQVDPTLARS